jgi:vacuolar-type H+-ATPase subunit H
MLDDRVSQSPEILKAIQAAERKVQRMVRSAEQEAAAIVERGKSRADALLAEKRRSVEQNLQCLRAEWDRDMEREVERLVLKAQVEANDLKAKGLSRLEEAAAVVLRRILPMTEGEERRAARSSQLAGS